MATILRRATATGQILPLPATCRHDASVVRISIANHSRRQSSSQFQSQQRYFLPISRSTAQQRPLHTNSSSNSILNRSPLSNPLSFFEAPNRLPRSRYQCLRSSRNLSTTTQLKQTSTSTTAAAGGGSAGAPVAEEVLQHPLQTYNVTKADARPVLSSHHKITFDEKKVLVPWEEGKTSTFHNIWLRDHCQCSACRHPETQQRLVDTFSIPKDIQASEVEPQEKGLKITWKNDKHESYFSFEWLHLHSYSPRLQRYLSPRFKLWGSEIEKAPPEVEYEEVMASDAGVAKWTSKIYTYGFCYVNGVPVTAEDTKKLVERIAHIRETHYGGFWDFTADLSKKDTAYTNIALAAHTDTTYFSEPAGLQLFHLLHHTDGAGGQSLLVDGFKAARVLRDTKPEAYRVLSNVRIPAHASGNLDVSVKPYAPFPVFNHHPVNGELIQVRWNNDDRATMDRWDDAAVEVEAFYEACREWNEVLRRREGEYWEQLVPGRALIFDNWRVLHGRSSFSGSRRLCGAYVSRDDFMSRFLVTNATREQVLKAV
ncbi:hypothetical protein DFH27DRAFT_551694 [Peziza echinospora]|nr:hypothetical protein DFH27DRAFT_551694 [Peziza echinospora]